MVTAMTTTVPIKAVVAAAFSAVLSAQGSTPNSVGALSQQTQDFDVASVRPNGPDDTTSVNRWNLRNGRLTLTNQTLVQFIAKAYGPRLFPALPRERIMGGPDWVGRDRFSIEARMPDGINPTQAETSMQTMLRRLLQERFRLKVRIDTRQVSGYSLVMLRPGLLGPEVRRSEVDCDVAQCGAEGGLAKYEARGMQMFMVARFLEDVVGAPIADATGFDGAVDGLLRWTPTPEQLRRTGVDAATAPQFTGPSIFTALQEQWGLRLNGGRVPLDYVFIEAAERPTFD